MELTKQQALERIEELKKYIKQIEGYIDIKESFTWYEEKNKDMNFSSLKSIGGSANLQGCSANLSSLENIDGSVYLEGCSSDLSSLENIDGYANLEGCSLFLKKSLAKTLKKCRGIYVEFKDKPMTLEEFKNEYREK